MMIKVIRCLSLLVFLSITGCSFFYGEDGLIKDTSYQYLDIEPTNEIKVPEGLKHQNKVDYAQIPNIGEEAKKYQIGKKLVNKPPVEVLDVSDNVRVDKKSVVPAVYIEESKDFLWQTLTDFFVSREVTPEVIDIEKYFLDTGWIAQEKQSVWNGIENNQEIDEYRTQYHFQMLMVKEPNQLRLEVQQVAAQSLDEDSKVWQKDVIHQDATHMMNMFLAYYDRQITQKRIQAAKIARHFKVNLGTDSERSAALVTDASKKVVWQQLPKILKEANFEVNDLDKSQATYFFKYEKNEPGFFASLFGKKEIVLPLESGDYQASLSSLGELTAITLRNAQGEPLSDELMAKLYPFLSQYFGQNS